MFAKRSETTLGRLTFRIVASLTILALMSGATFVFAEITLKEEETRVAVVNIAGRQRMLSQRIAVLAALLAANSDPSTRARLRQKLQKSITAMETTHNTLLRNTGGLDLPGNLSPELQTIYFEPPLNLDTQVRRFLDTARALAQTPEASLTPDNALLQNILATAENGLLGALDAAVTQYQMESQAVLTRLKWVTALELLVTLLALTFIGLFAFRPVLRRAQEEEAALRESEARNSAILDALPDIVFIQDKRGVYLDFHAPPGNDLFVPPDEFLNRPMDDVLPLALARQANQSIERALQSGQTQTLEYNLPIGDTLRHYEARIVPFAADRVLTIIRDITDQVQAEAKFRTLLENAPEAIVIVNQTGEMVLVNAQTETMFGFSRQELLGRSVEMLIPERFCDEYRSFQAVCSTAPRIRSKRKGLASYGLRRDGSEIPLEISLSPLQTEEGLLIFAAIRDISEQVQAEESLRKSEARLAAAQRIAHLGSWDWDIVANTLYWSDEVYRIFGLPPQEFGVTYDTFLTFIHPDDRALVIKTVDEALHQHKPYSINHRIIRHDGVERVVHEQGEVTFDETGRAIQMVGTVQDITERVRAEEELQKRLAHLDLLNRITHAVATRLDLSSIFRVVLSRLTEHGLADTGAAALYDPQSDALMVLAISADSVPQAAQMGITQGTVLPVKQTGLRPCIEGHVLYRPDLRQSEHPLFQNIAQRGFHSFIALSLQTQEETVGVLVLLRREKDAFSPTEQDFLKQLGEHIALAAHHARLYQELESAYDELRQTRQAVLREERLRALGQMASGIAHDINNALSPIVGFSDLLLMREDGLSERARRLLQHIKTAGEDIAHIVERMREFYRKREAQEILLPVDLKPIVEQVIELTRPRWRDMPQEQGIAIAIQTDLQTNLPPVMGVESELREMLANLIGNAVDAMPQGGTITLRTCRFGEAIILEVADTGEGMDEETRLRCLEPFYTTKGEKGTGLGLAMVFGMMQRYEGEIEIESKMGRGTTIRLIFPYRQLAEGEIEIPASSETAVVPLRILCIDDDPMVRTLLLEMLAGEGHTVTIADGGQAGLDAFRAARRKEQPFDVVITDLGMPYMDGRRVARAVKHESPQTPVILLTGWGARMRTEKDIPAAVDVVLSKPPRLAQLQETLRRLSS